MPSQYFIFAELGDKENTSPECVKLTRFLGVSYPHAADPAADCLCANVIVRALLLSEASNLSN